MSKLLVHPARPRSAQTALVLALLWAAGCAHRTPVALAPSLEPVSAPFTERGAVEVKRCRPLLFGFIPLRPDYGMQDLISEAAQRGDGLVRVGVDQISSFWLIGQTTCHALSGTQIQLAPTAVQAGGNGPPPGAPRAAPPPAVSRAMGDAAGLPASAYHITDTIYARMGRQRPAEDAAYLIDVQAVWEQAQRGYPASDLLAAAQRGLEKLGPDASIAELLAAGLAATP